MNLYFISNGNGAIKIGVAKDVRERMRQLQTASPTKLVLLWAIPGTEAEEREVHVMFREERMEGEWFRDGPRIRQFLEAESAVCEAMQATAAWHIARGTAGARMNRLAD